MEFKKTHFQTTSQIINDYNLTNFLKKKKKTFILNKQAIFTYIGRSNIEVILDFIL